MQGLGSIRLSCSFYVRLRYEKQKIVWIVGLAGLFWLSIRLVLSMADTLRGDS